MVPTWLQGALVCSCLALSGCLLTESVNVATAISIDAPLGPFYRGDKATFKVKASDPARALSFRWGHLAGPCAVKFDSTALSDEARDSPTFELKPGRDELGELCVWVEAMDSRGARSVSTSLILVEDRAAVAKITQLSPSPGSDVPLGIQVAVKSETSDPDGDDVPAYELVLQTPNGTEASFGACDETVPDAKNARCFVVTSSGTWQVKVKWKVQPAARRLNSETMLAVKADIDHPPCVNGVPASSFLVHDASKALRLEVNVRDDLDSAPAIGTFESKAAFIWSESQSATGPFLADVDNKDRFRVIGENRYRTGDELFVRVDVADRVQRVSTCTATDDLCPSVICSQRMTWKVQFR